MTAAGFMSLTSQASKAGWGVGGQRRFWVRPILSKQKAHGGDELLVDFRNYVVGLCGDLRSSFGFLF